MAELKITAAQKSEAGIKPANDDAIGIRVPDDENMLRTKGVAAVIADGMSGSEGGREAADACVTGFLNDYFSTPDSWTVETSGEKILGALNRWLYSQGQKQYGTPRGLVTTLSVLILKSTTAYLFHIGDTRIYRLRGEDFEQLTIDHRVAVGEKKTYLGRAMGIDLHLEIDYRALPVETGDIYLLTTDGVHDFLDDVTLKRLLVEHYRDPQGAVDAILRHAANAGSDDNLSAQVIRVESLPEGDEEEFYRRLTELPFPPPLEPGMKLDGYRILRELHASNRTQIYLALDERSGEKVVLKTPSVNYEDDPLYIEQFLHEEWAGRRLNSPHLLRVLPAPERRQFLYYVTEYVEGQTLREWMHDHPQPEPAEVRPIVEQIAQGLRVMHRQEMLHQDLKPENILIDSHGVVKIIDFGSTRIAGIAEIRTPLERDNLLGTRNYTAPEYLQGLPATNRADIFSLGVITYEMLTGRLPYDRELNARNLRRARYRPASEVNPAVPRWMDEALRKAVSIDPQKRYALLSEFTHDLRSPNPEFLRETRQPLIERNPLGFWKTLALISLLINLALLIALAA